jgi:hypothetical protein
LVERLRVENGLQGLQVESDLWDLRSEGAPQLPPDVVLSILYTLLPLRDIYADLLAAILWDGVKAAFSRRGRRDSTAVFVMCKVDEDGRILKSVRGETTNPRLIKHLIDRLGEQDEG